MEHFSISNDGFCIVGVGNGEAYMIIEGKLNVGYNLYQNQWKNGKSLPNYGHLYTGCNKKNGHPFYTKFELFLIIFGKSDEKMPN